MRRLEAVGMTDEVDDLVEPYLVLDVDERGGKGRWRRSAARRSPGASNATAGRPKVVPRREARPPPRE